MVFKPLEPPSPSMVLTSFMKKFYTYTELTTIMLPIQTKTLIVVVDQIQKIQRIANVFSTRCVQESANKDDLRTETLSLEFIAKKNKK